MNRNFLMTMMVVLLVSAMTMSGCKKDKTPTDALDSARRSLSVGDIERCAKEEFEAARALLAQAEEATKAKKWDKAEDLARQAAAQAQHARRVAEANPDCQEKPVVDDKPATTQEPSAGAYEFKTIHFGFDSTEISGENRRILEAHGNELRKNADLRIRVEGHCSDEGTPEYNLALGNRRARAVRDFLVRYGIDESRIDTISYGEERPVGRADENRRAEFRIR